MGKSWSSNLPRSAARGLLAGHDGAFEGQVRKAVLDPARLRIADYFRNRSAWQFWRLQAARPSGAVISCSRDVMTIATARTAGESLSPQTGGINPEEVAKRLV